MKNINLSWRTYLAKGLPSCNSNKYTPATSQDNISLVASATSGAILNRNQIWAKFSRRFYKTKNRRHTSSKMQEILHWHLIVKICTSPKYCGTSIILQDMFVISSGRWRACLNITVTNSWYNNIEKLQVRSHRKKKRSATLQSTWFLARPLSDPSIISRILLALCLI